MEKLQPNVIMSSSFRQVICEVASSEIPVLLLGEPGVGKRMAARQVHDAAPWSSAPFLECDCRLADDHLIRQMFRLDQPEDAPFTIFFEKVECLTAQAQKSLLAAIEAQEAAKRKYPRVIASGSADLDVQVRSGQFREDLYYKLCGICLRIPPLRHRKDDIRALAEQFLRDYAVRFNRPVPELTPALQKFLYTHPWTGNLRELEDAMRTVVAVGNVTVAIAALRSASDAHHHDKRHSSDVMPLKQVARAASQRAEREMILKVLSRTNWNRKKAAEELRISYKALLYKLKEIGSSPSSMAGPEGKSE